MSFNTAANKLRQAIEHGTDIIVAPGVHDGFSARIAQSVGFDCLYMTGAGTTASRLGHADLGIATQSDMVAHSSMIAQLSPSVPLIADADTGYGGPIMVARTIELYARGGVAGLHIEDQVQTKRCGHLAGKEVVDVSVYAARIRAAKTAREKVGSDIVIIARTDALQGMGYDAAVERLKAAREAGADVGFLEGVTDREMARRVVRDLAPWPMLLNMVEHGATPTISVAEAREMGYRVVIFPFASIAPAYVAMKEGFEKLKETGVVGAPEFFTPKFCFQVCGLDESMALDEAAGGKAFGAKGA
ncbi:2,3-dimethylmalate lyase [Lasiodiplodia hormozganensis]|uniref:2,3-dimethylmalate lyase n=1 Tax=Lasiodiplodia hormozganensis TaxID=869390 RepID=A0AA39W9V5_9PEZI|nr:2,3-dimethylmalate lyase [Lasiodiplodia hormozganensis]